MSTTDLGISAENIQHPGDSFNRSQSTRAGNAASDVASSHKRPASPIFDEDRKDRKRMKGEMDGSIDQQSSMHEHQPIDGQTLVDDLSQELQCGCCSGLVYKPVIVVPCDHFFCGSCCTLWVKNGGTNCPACRSISTAVIPSRPLQAMVDVLLRAAPHLQRTERERMQADEIYPVSRPFRIPVPREPSPEPVIPPSSEFLQPCPHCVPNNPFHWACPQPIADHAADPGNAWRIDAGAPPGHGFCGNCEVVLALQAPSTSRCDFCQVSFCGINVQGRCVALPIAVQSPHGMSDVGDLIQSPEIYECFESNTAEVELMLDYMTTQRLSPKQIYRQVAAHIQAQPEGFHPLIEQELFMDMHGVSGGTDPGPTAPRRLICRLCAAEVFLYGLRDWWIRERQKAVIEGKLEERRDCLDGPSCGQLSDAAHAKEFNHLFGPGNVELVPQAAASSSSILPPHAAGNRDMSPSVTSSLFLPPIHSESPPSTSADLPSISNLVAEFTRPRFDIPNDLFVRFNPSLDEEQREQRSIGGPPSVDTQSTPPPQENLHIERRDELIHSTAADDFEFAEPSSSQSRRSVDAQLAHNLLADYGSETGSDVEERREGIHRGTDADAQFEAYLSAAAATVAQAEADIQSIRRAHSPLKVDSESDMPMMDDRPQLPPMSAFMPFHFLASDITYGPTETGTPPASGAYPVHVE
ncbi:hypothetical protein ACEPAI_9542 [Sanghuangporus weigelae]